MEAEHIVEKAIKAGFEEAVASVFSTRKAYLKIANSKTDSIVEKRQESAVLYVSSKKRLMFTNIERLDEASLDRSIANAKRIISMIKPKEDYFGIAEGPFSYKRIKLGYDKKLEGDMNAELSSMAESAINAVLELGASAVAGTVVAGVSCEQLATSAHASAESKDTMVRLSLRPFFGTVSVQDIIASRELSGIRPAQFAEKIANTALSARHFDRLSQGTYDVIYAPSPAGLILSNVNSMVCMGSIETGSPFAGKLGKRVASDGLSMFDSAIEQDGINSSAYDAEGYPTQKTGIIEDGILKTYLHNASTARKYHTRSTGNAGLIDPAPNTAVLAHKNTKKSLDALIGDVDKGVLITNTWYLRFSNDVTGAFSTVPRDLAVFIERGEPKFAIKHMAGTEATGIRISDTIPHMLKNIEAVAEKPVQSTSWDTEGYYYFMPYVLTKDVKFTVA
ncbi:MAG: TldD/PmbA family protein [Candidatus Micrarchaeia archaeon]